MILAFEAPRYGRGWMCILLLIISGCQAEQHEALYSESQPVGAAAMTDEAAQPDMMANVQAQGRVTTVNGVGNFDSKITPYAFVLSTAVWQKGSDGFTNIDVCWENPDAQYDAEQALVRKAVEATWQAYSRIKFAGWKKCVNGNYGIHILVEDSGPHTKGLGSKLNQVSNGMVLNFTFKNWSQTCSQSKKMRDKCIYSIAVHEFGHAIAYAHEQNRYDTPGECAIRRQGSDGDLLLTSYDPSSVMNYCNPVYNNNGVLSERDKIGLAMAYGAPK